MSRREGSWDILVDQVGDLGRVHVDSILASLPMRREDHDRTRLDFLGNLASNLAQFAMGRVVMLEHDIRLGSIRIRSPSNLNLERI